jgi:thiol-disulfide isomerase/thioredoxin
MFLKSKFAINLFIMLNIKYILIFSFLGLNLFSQSRSNSFSQIEIESKETNKPVILIFSGIDWCAPCIKMEKEIFNTEYFKNNSSNFLIYFAKFPRRSKNKLDLKLQEENKILAEKYNKQGVFPKIVIFNEDLKVIKELYYENTTPEEFVKKINSILNEN